MNITIVNSHKPIVQNIASVIQTALKDKINLFMWDKGRISAYDMFDLVNPDIILLFAKDITNDLTGLMDEKPEMKMVVMECEGIFEPFIAFNPDPACNPLQYIGKRKEKYVSKYAAFSNGPSFQRFYDFMEKGKARIYGDPVNSTAYVGQIGSIKQKADIIKSTECFIAFDEYEMLNSYLIGTPCTTFGLNPSKYPDEATFSDTASLNDSVDKATLNRKLALENTAHHQTATLFSSLNINIFNEDIWTHLQKLALS